MKILLTALFLSIPSLAFADGGGALGGLGGLMPLILIFAVFYILIIRPQQKKASDHTKMVNALKRDDKVITSGGIYGRITNVKGEILEMEIADGVKVDVSKNFISVVLNESEAVVPEVIKK